MEPIIEKVILVAIARDGLSALQESLDELTGLVEAAGAIVVGIADQSRDRPDPATYIGRGKADEIAQMKDELEASLIVVDDELSGSTIRNLSEATGLPVIDRTALILDIFATRSRSGIAKLQVELAQQQYRRSRLIGLGAMLSQQGGGIGTRGPGETKLETDRRHIDLRISELRRRLRSQQAVRDTQRKRRTDTPEKIVALVGYTNAGKSSIMNYFLNYYDAEGAQVYERDMLFATLDVYVRRIELDANRRFLLVDTVGFVNRLPHSLVEAFKATLSEVAQADLLIHVLDANQDKLELQQKATEAVLQEIGAEQLPMITVLNKWDLEGQYRIAGPALAVSAKTGEGMERLVEQIDRALFSDQRVVEMFFRFDQAGAMSRLLEEAEIKDQTHEATGTRLRLMTDAIQREKYQEYIVENDHPAL
ncbi:MAG TPA: GTPase HflX [Tissierellia bacterium]|nr:GTPase HflX [Tissierellia bacterium]